MSKRFRLDKSDVSGRVLDKLSLQKYATAKLISGVRFMDFDFFSDDGGDFHGILRLNNGAALNVEGFDLRQMAPLNEG
jgi:hypothetical protein